MSHMISDMSLTLALPRQLVLRDPFKILKLTKILKLVFGRKLPLWENVKDQNNLPGI